METIKIPIRLSRFTRLLAAISLCSLFLSRALKSKEAMNSLLSVPSESFHVANFPRITRHSTRVMWQCWKAPCYLLIVNQNRRHILRYTVVNFIAEWSRVILQLLLRNTNILIFLSAWSLFLVIFQINQFFMPSERVVEWTNSSMCRVTRALLSSIFSSKIPATTTALFVNFLFLSKGNIRGKLGK